MNSEVTLVDEWRPNWHKTCHNCGETPCVQGWQINRLLSPESPPQDALVYDGDLCGVCTWGEASCLDPENW